MSRSASAVPKKRMTVRVIASILITDDAGEWSRVNSFELVGKEFAHNDALRRWISNGKHKTEDLTMVDENTVEAQGPDANGHQTKTVYSVLRYSGQCPECGAAVGKPNAWCSLCMSQAAVREETFDAQAALKALMNGKPLAEEVAE